MALIVRCFGSSTPTGKAWQALAAEGLGLAAIQLCRRPQVDLLISETLPAPLADQASIWLSFAPIWLLAPCLAELSRIAPERLQGLTAVIACSSSSVLTKRYAVSAFDRQLVARLRAAEDLLITTCHALGIACRILRPTLIYGRAGDAGDRNLSRLLGLMRRLPVLPVPSPAGLRQPIHCCQLAAVALKLVQQVLNGGLDPALPQRLALGGDTTLSYLDMLAAMQQALPHGDPARRCRLLPVPARLAQWAAAPLLLASPKTFEAVQRMSADLAGFTPCHQLLGTDPEPFPVLPLAL